MWNSALPVQVIAQRKIRLASRNARTAPHRRACSVAGPITLPSSQAESREAGQGRLRPQDCLRNTIIQIRLIVLSRAGDS